MRRNEKAVLLHLIERRGENCRTKSCKGCLIQMRQVCSTQGEAGIGPVYKQRYHLAVELYIAKYGTDDLVEVLL